MPWLLRGQRALQRQVAFHGLSHILRNFVQVQVTLAPRAGTPLHLQGRLWLHGLGLCLVRLLLLKWIVGQVGLIWQLIILPLLQLMLLLPIPLRYLLLLLLLFIQQLPWIRIRKSLLLLFPRILRCGWRGRPCHPQPRRAPRGRRPSWVSAADGVAEARGWRLLRGCGLRWSPLRGRWHGRRRGRLRTTAGCRRRGRPGPSLRRHGRRLRVWPIIVAAHLACVWRRMRRRVLS
mmetsp:Transcript_29151/g.74057  ORF Transcript_29151/g.74057 Transcript_29151/m.74057 type:complete len:233 (-) Transcript_29151:94-792(-)